LRWKCGIAERRKKALLRSNQRLLIQEKLALLATSFFESGHNVTQLRGRDEWRLRVQDWRVIFVVENDIIFVRDIAARGSAYEVTR